MYKKITYSQKKKKHNSASCKLTQIHGVPCVERVQIHTQNRSRPIIAFRCRDPKEKKVLFP